MRVFRRIAALAALTLVFSGCASVQDRSIVLNELNPAPMPARDWARVVGSFTGPIRASTNRGGYEGLEAMEIRLDISGWADTPAIWLKVERGYSTSWTEYGEWKGVLTNIPDRQYGAQGQVNASTHAPNQLLLKLRRNGSATKQGAWLIVTFRDDGDADVDWIGRSGWRGEGNLLRTPNSYNPR